MTEVFKGEIDDYLSKKFSELNTLYRELENAYKLIESFSYTFIHDLKASIRSISGYARILNDDITRTLDQYGTGLLDKIIKGAHKMSSFIEDILHFCKAQSAEIKYVMVDLNEVMKEIFEVHKPLMKKTKQMNCAIKSEVYGDKTSLEQLLSHLLSNAIKYSYHQEFL